MAGDWLSWLRKGKKNPATELPDWYATYLGCFSAPPPPHTPVEELRVVVLDAETTGLDVRRDRMLSIGALRISGNSISLADKFEDYLPTPPGADRSRSVLIHGIIPNSTRYRLTTEPRLLEDLLGYLGGDIIVGHHIGFDLTMIDQALRRVGAAPLRNTTVDTARVAQRIRPAGYWTPDQDFSLDALAKRYAIPLSDRHTALGDCYITAVLYLKLLRRLSIKLDRGVRLEDVTGK